MKPLFFSVRRFLPDRLLAPREAVLRVTGGHVVTVTVLLPLVLTAVLLLLTWTRPNAVEVALADRWPLVVAVTTAVAVLPFLLDWFTTRFVLTHRAVLHLPWPIWLLSESLKRSTFDGLPQRHDPIVPLFGLGDVAMKSAANQGGHLVIDFVSDPEAILRRLAAVRPSCRGGGR